MLEYFGEWVQKIAYYMILVTLVMQVAAGESYRKYIRLFTGIILILFILSPVIRFFKMDGEGFLLSAESGYEKAAQQIEEKMQEIEEEAFAVYGAGETGSTGKADEAEEADSTGKLSETGRIEVGEIRIGR